MFPPWTTFATIAVSGFVIGGAAIAAGAVLVYLNQPRAVMPDERVRLAIGPGSVALALDY